MARILETRSRSLKELRLLPALTALDGGMREVSIATRLCRGPGGEGWIALTAPFLGAAMQAVTGPEMAIALAQLGGIGVVPVSQPIER